MAEGNRMDVVEAVEGGDEFEAEGSEGSAFEERSDRHDFLGEFGPQLCECVFVEHIDEVAEGVNPRSSHQHQNLSPT